MKLKMFSVKNWIVGFSFVSLDFVGVIDTSINFLVLLAVFIVDGNVFDLLL